MEQAGTAEWDAASTRRTPCRSRPRPRSGWPTNTMPLRSGARSVDRLYESRSGRERHLPPIAADVGLCRKDINDARLVRDAEQARGNAHDELIVSAPRPAPCRSRRAPRSGWPTNTMLRRSGRAAAVPDAGRSGRDGGGAGRHIRSPRALRWIKAPAAGPGCASTGCGTSSIAARSRATMCRASTSVEASRCRPSLARSASSATACTWLIQ